MFIGALGRAKLDGIAFQAWFKLADTANSISDDKTTAGIVFR